LKKGILLGGVLLLVLAGCVSQEQALPVHLSHLVAESELTRPAPTQEEQIITFGFDRRLEPKEDVKMYVSFLRYLERETGYRFKLHVSSRDGGVVRDLGIGVVQFAAIGTLSYLQARQRYGVRMLVRGLNAEGKGEYQAIIFTRPDSDIQSIEDIRGRSFAFGARTSTQGHLLPRLMLAEVGIELADLKAFEYTGSHADCANAVISGRYEVGGMQDTLARSLAERGLIRIIAVSRYYPSSGIAVNPNVDPQIVNVVKEALLTFDPLGEDAAGLYHWERSEMPNGFISANDADYVELQRWAERFGLLD